MELKPPTLWKSILPSLQPCRTDPLHGLPFLAYHPFRVRRTCIADHLLAGTIRRPVTRPFHIQSWLINHHLSPMDSTLSCLLLPLPSAQRRPCRPKFIKRDHDGPGSSGVKTGRGGRGTGRFCAKALFGDGGGDGFRTIRRMVKLNSAIQNRSVRELLELMADECLYFLRDLRSIDLSQMGKDMFLLLHAMMVRHNVSFVLKPTENDAGFDLGIKWSLEWKGKKLPWDIDCNVSTSHVYRGILLISQVNKTCVPLMQRILQMIQQNLDAILLTIVHKVLPQGTLDENTARTVISCVIIGLAFMVLFYAMCKNL